LRRFGCTCAVTFCVLLAYRSVSAAELYVDRYRRGGVCDDSNPGTAIDHPLCTIQAALRLAGPGDRIIIRDGTYSENVVPGVDGTADAPIVLRSFEGETATISGAEPLALPGRLVASGRRLLELERTVPPYGFVQLVDRERANVGCPVRVPYGRDRVGETTGDVGPRDGYWRWDGTQTPGRIRLRVSNDVARCEAAGVRYTWLEIVREIDLSRRRHVAFQDVRFEDVTLRLADEGSVTFEDCVFASASVTSSAATAADQTSEVLRRAGSPTIVGAGEAPCGIDCDQPPSTGGLTPMPVEAGGTGATDAENALANLGAAADGDVVHLFGEQMITGPKIFSAPGIGVQISGGAYAGSVGVGTPPNGVAGDLSVGRAIHLGANQAIYWPTFSPVQTRFFLGTSGSGTPLHDQDDNVICRAYNTDCSGQKFVEGEHTFKDQLEATYDSSTGPGVVEAVEMNWDFSPDNSPYTWRPFAMFLDTSANAGDGTAEFGWQLQRGSAFALELRGNKVAVNRDAAATGMAGTFNVFSRLEGEMTGTVFGSYLAGTVRHENDGTSWDYVGSVTDVTYDSASPQSALGGMFGLRTNVTVSGDDPARVVNRAVGHEINLSLAGSGTVQNWTGLDIGFDPSGANATVNGQVALIRLTSPGPSGPGTTVSGYYGIDIEDLRGVGTWGNAILIRTQSGGANEGNLHFQGGNWNSGHLTFGVSHLWFDPGSSRLRVSTTTPGSASSGNAVVTGTASNTYGPAAWAADGVSGTTACNAMGLTCVDSYETGARSPAGCGSPVNTRVVMCK
jgi:hypothetical protein